MLIIRTTGILFEHLLPLIREQEAKGFKYLRDEDDGLAGRAGVNLCCVKRVYFDDARPEVTYVDQVRE